MSQDTPTPPNRRRILGSTTLCAAVGLITGLAAGVALALPPKSPPVTTLGQEVEREIKAAGGEALYVKADVLVEDEVRTFVDATVGAYGRLDVAFNNAGITIEKPLHEYSVEEWDRVNNTTPTCAASSSP